jgi:DNA helicase-2/ATP-dependent DNA helicase PcrA
VPRRGIGPTSLQQMHQYAKDNEVSLMESALRLIQDDALKGPARRGLVELIRDVGLWRSQLCLKKPAELTQMILDESGYTKMWQEDKSPDAPARLENLKELVSAIRGFESLPAFLEHISLVMENTAHAKETQDLFTLMTLHSAKGLEFDVVFLPGWEEGIFPNPRSIDEGNLEEERRLAYVGLTRARQQVFITHALNRRIYGTWQSCTSSRFIDELPTQYVDYESSKRKVVPFTTPRSTPQAKVVVAAPVERIEEKNLCQFKRGERVFHGTFGYGRIVAIQGMKCEVAFDRGPRRAVLASFLQKRAA